MAEVIVIVSGGMVVGAYADEQVHLHIADLDNPKSPLGDLINQALLEKTKQGYRVNREKFAYRVL